MARVVTQQQARDLGLPGRRSLELVSRELGQGSMTLRLVEIPVAVSGETPRAPHRHTRTEECIFVLSGQGTTHADSGEFALRAGDTIVIPRGEWHVTRNTGAEPLVLLCFFPVAEVGPGTEQAAAGRQ